MAGFIQRTYKGVSPIMHIICMVIGLIHFCFSIVEIVYYNRWMNQFISFQYHKVLFAYFHVSSYILIVFSLIILKIQYNDSSRDICGLFASLFMITIMITASAATLACIINWKPNITQQCSSYHEEINTIERAKTVFCQSCQCYLFRQPMGLFPNMTNSNSDAASKVQDCPGWTSTETDNRVAQVQSDLGCSGWCQQQLIYYFSPNDYWYYSNQTGWQHRRRQVTKSCFTTIKSTIQHAFYRFPIALISIVLLCYCYHIAVTLQFVRAGGK